MTEIAHELPASSIHFMALSKHHDYLTPPSFFSLAPRNEIHNSDF